MFEIVRLDPPAPAGPGPFRIECRAKNLAGATWTRAVSGGNGQPLTVEDTLTADEPGTYEAVFRLRLLGQVEGAAGRWEARQKSAVLPIALATAAGDAVAIGPWMPDNHADSGGAYPWYAFADGGGIPKTLEWKRTVSLDRGQTTVLRATLGPSRKVP